MRVRVTTFYFCIILASLFLAALLHLEYLGVAICFIMSLIIAIYSKKDDYSVIIFAFVLIILQNLLIGIGAHIGANTSANLKFLSQYPTIFVFCVGGLTLIKKKKDVIDWLAFVIMLILSLAFVSSPVAAGTKLIYFRNCLMFYFSYLCGRRVNNQEDLDIVMSRIVNITVIICIIGFAMMLMPVRYWFNIGLREVYIAKGTSESTFSVNGLPIRFYTSIGKFRFYRMASIVYEPVNLSYILAGAVIFSFLTAKVKYLHVKRTILFLGIVLTFGKGGLLIVFLELIYVIMNDILRRITLSKRLKKLLIITALSGMVAIFAIFYNRNIGGSASAHFRSIINTFSSVINKPLGYGLGRGGNYAEVTISSSFAGKESGLMAILYQLGIPFTSIFSLIFILMTFKIKADNRYYAAISFMPCCILIACLFQENTLGPQCCFIFMCIVGSVIMLKQIGDSRENIVSQ